MEKQITVTFDRNVYEFVVDLEKEGSSASEKTEYQRIQYLIKNGTILPFISESVFTLETLSRKNGNRRKILGNRERIVVVNNEEDGYKNPALITIGSNPYIHPGNHKKDDEFLAKAIKLGFKILPIYRFGRIVNPAIKSEWRHIVHSEDRLEMPTKFSKVLEIIESNGIGFAKVKALLGITPEDTIPWTEHIQYYSGTDKKFNEAIAEWSDGDSIASHITFGIDYFCTNDTAKNAGGKSVFSEKFRGLFSKSHGLKVFSPSELLAHF
jgi:hypothetical protein